MSVIEYRKDFPFAAADIAAVFDASGIRRPTHDLAVDKDYQRHGIRRELIARVRTAIGEEVALILLSAPEAMAYYPKVGFERIENGFIIKRNR